MKNRKIALLPWILIAGLLWYIQVNAQYMIPSSTFSSGSVIGTDTGNYRMESTTGQPLTGTSSNNNFIHSLGFWYYQTNVFTDIQTTTQLLPDQFNLFQNYPNPFNPVTHIRFDLPEAGDVKIEIFTILGEKVYTLIDGHMPVGYHNIEFNAVNYASGVYLYRLQAGDYVETRKMILMR